MPVTALLDTEWDALACSPLARRTLIRWSRSYPALAGLADFAALLERRRDPAVANDVLAALAELAPSDEMASRVLLQALLPGLVRLAATAGYDDPSALDEMVSLAWERIRTYPTTRRGSVAANVLWDVRKWYRRHRLIEAPRSVPLDKLDERAAPGVESAEATVLAGVAVAELGQACRDGVISDAALALIVRTRLGGEALADIAADEDVNVHRLAQRRWRAECRLRALPWAS
ncbi:MAG TPA: hypothetical protein VNQ73_01135 [Ilumatobacter sp.]|nr:hypothetical protein [Ilumatobacter sp.]